jgi:hypothetical protein
VNIRGSGRATLVAVVVIAIIALALAVALPSLRGRVAQAAESTEPQHMLTVSGEGVVHARPDIARVTLGVETQAATASEAQAANAAVMDKVVAKLRELDIKNEDMKTVSFRLNPNYDYENTEKGGPRLVGFRATNEITVTLRDLAAVGEIVDECVALGANSIGGVSFELENEAALREQALTLAVADAKKRAQLLARSMDLGGLRPVSVTAVSGSPGYNQPMMEYARLGGGAAANTPVMPGEYTITVQVQVQYTF